MPSDFAINPEPIKSSTSEQMSLLDKLALETYLDLSQYFAHKKIDLLKQYVFNSASKFLNVVAADRTRFLYPLAHIIQYDVTKHSKMNKHYA